MSQPEGQENPAAEYPAPSAAQHGPIATQVLAADDDFNDNDSAIEEGNESSTASLASSIYKFRQEHGRTYNAYGSRTYWMPNDEPERDRLDFQHHLFRMTINGKLYTSNIDTKKSSVSLMSEPVRAYGPWTMRTSTLKQKSLE